MSGDTPSVFASAFPRPIHDIEEELETVTQLLDELPGDALQLLSFQQYREHQQELLEELRVRSRFDAEYGRLKDVIPDAQRMRSVAADALAKIYESPERDSLDILSYIFILHTSRRYTEVADAIFQHTGDLTSYHNSVARHIEDEAAFVARIFALQRGAFHSAVRQCQQALRHEIGVIRDRYCATAAWLHICIDGKYTTEVSLNAQRLTPREFHQTWLPAPTSDDSKRSIVVEKVEKRFKTSRDDSQSVLAVPVRLDEECLAWVHLESSEPYAFTESLARMLAEEAAVLIPDIVTLQYHLMYMDESEHDSGWHYKADGWGISSVLESFFRDITEELHRVGPQPAVIAWHHDSPSGEFWVKASDGYDYEYQTRAPLPRVDSFTSTGSKLAPGTVLRSHWKDRPEFYRRRKALRTGLNQVIATPLINDGHSIGALTLYSFAIEIDISDCVILHFADHVSQLIAWHEQVQPKAAKARVRRYLVEQRSLVAVDTFPFMLHRILELCLADAGSIFTRDKNSDDVLCVATTGVTREGRTFDEPGLVSYSLKDEGFTSALFNKPGSVIRRNDLRRRSGNTSSEFLPLRKYQERFALSTQDHRRFLGVSSGLYEDDRAELVIRILRRAHSRPFIESDEALLKAIADALLLVTKQWRRERLSNDFVELVVADCPAIVRTEVRARALRRIITPAAADYGSTQLLVEEVLQNCSVTLEHWGCLQASVHEVFDSGTGPSATLRAFHSGFSEQWPGDGEFDVIENTRESPAWRALREWKVVTGHATAKQNAFHEHSDQHYAKSTLCIPFNGWSAGAISHWLLSIDFEREVAWDEAIMRVPLYAAQKLSAILSNRTIVFLPSLIHCMKGFAAETSATMDGCDCLLSLNGRSSGGANRSIRARLGNAQAGVNWEPISDQLGFSIVSESAFVVEKSSLGVPRMRFPLLFGGVKAGECEVSAIGASPEKLIQVMQVWSGLTAFPGYEDPAWFWTCSGERAVPNSGGLEVWNIDAHLVVPDTFSGEEVIASDEDRGLLRGIA